MTERLGAAKPQIYSVDRFEVPHKKPAALPKDLHVLRGNVGVGRKRDGAIRAADAHFGPDDGVLRARRPVLGDDDEACRWGRFGRSMGRLFRGSVGQRFR
jgi:diadenosine tetraphosphatase ApaH/serine/threonine PP2A family protein phosphatase